MLSEKDWKECDFYSIKQFAAKIGVHPNTVRRSILKGKLSAIKVGTGRKCFYRISKTEIQRIAFLDLREYIEKVIQEEKKKF